MNTNTIDEIENLDWSEPKLIKTRGGEKMVKSAEPNEGFWNLWRDYKEEMRTAGFSIGKWGGQWRVDWWQNEGQFKTLVLPDGEEPTEEWGPLPVLKDESNLLKYQVDVVRSLTLSMQKFKASLNGCGTGLGKTFMTLGVIRERGRKALIICPKNIVDDWKDAAKIVGVDLVGVYGWEWMKTGKTDFLRWTFRRVKRKVGNDYILKDVKDQMEWTIPPDVDVVFDEVHRAAYPDTQNSKMVQQAKDYGLNIYGLSATIADTPVKMKAVGYILGLHKNGQDFVRWMSEHGVRMTRFGPEFSGTARHLRKLHHSIFPSRGVRLRAEQLGSEFPDTQILAKAYTIDESKEINSVYHEMMNRCAELEEQHASSACILVEVLRARQRVELLKVPLMVDLARDYMEEGNSIFLSVNFRDTMKELIARLGVQSVIMGGQKYETRKDMIEKFQSNEVNIIAGIIKACREGISLQDLHGGHPRVSLIMPTPSSFDLKQVLGRVHRAKGKTPSIQRILFAKDTIEEDVCRGLATKLDQLEVIMDGDLQKGIFPASYSSMRPQKPDEESEELTTS